LLVLTVKKIFQNVVYGFIFFFPVLIGIYHCSCCPLSYRCSFKLYKLFHFVEGKKGTK